MTTDELDAIPKSEWNALIAQRCGWTVKHDNGVPKNVCPYQMFDPDRLRVGYAFEEKTLWHDYAPNYTVSLDAMAQAEATLTGLQKDLYADLLVDVLKPS